MKIFHIVSLFPESFSYLKQSILGRAERERKIKVKIYQLRDFTKDKHHTTDDKPYGGGAGMVLKAEPVLRAVDSVKRKIGKGRRQKVIVLSAKGKQFNQKRAYEWLKKFDDIIFVSGRYEGIDERVVKALHAEEISIGPYVLTDGDAAIMVMISAVSRLAPGVIKLESLEEESYWNLLLKKEMKSVPAITTFSHSQECENVSESKREAKSKHGGGLEYPHYTRPEVFTYKGKKYSVPKVLLSGNHKKIEEWRKKQMS